MKPELLAPAKNLEIAIAAVNHGADAVYIGAPKFSARQAAGNTLREIEETIKYAHRYKTKIFVALNTLLYDNELEEAKNTAVKLYEMGADALIIQDMAFLEMDLPPIPLHASTQTHNTTPEKIKFLHDVGFARIILARELSPQQIAEIHKISNVELEAFVHGALCVSYSGQCYLSHALTGRSANRGACAQACRSSYNLIDNEGVCLIKNKHLLSLKDLNLSEHLQTLVNAGVCSFKIEGRLKDIAYVKNVVTLYRKNIDKLFFGKKNCSSGKIVYSFEPNPHKTFSRGFTSYFSAFNQQIASLNTAKSVGEYIGNILRVEKNSIILNAQKSPLNAGDGIIFFDKKNQLQGTNINKVEGNKIHIQKIPRDIIGSQVFRNFDFVFQRNLLRPNTAQRLIQLEFIFSETESEISITAVDEDEISVNVCFKKKHVKAKSIEKVKNTIQQQFEKIKEKNFYCTKIRLNPNTSGFYTISELNIYRREIITLLEQKRKQNYNFKQNPIVKNNIPYPEKELSFNGNVLNKLAELFYKRHQVQKISIGYELQKSFEKFALMTTRYCILNELNWCKKNKKSRNLSEPLFLENNGKKLQLFFDCK
ncbi:MAG: peptidase U32 family protein, partial [Bacteroidales bacterium]